MPRLSAGVRAVVTPQKAKKFFCLLGVAIATFGANENAQRYFAIKHSLSILAAIGDDKHQIAQKFEEVLRAKGTPDMAINALRQEKELNQTTLQQWGATLGAWQDMAKEQTLLFLATAALFGLLLVRIQNEPRP